jgi:hypothetical protein
MQLIIITLDTDCCLLSVIFADCTIYPRYAECHFAECRGAKFGPWIIYSADAWVSSKTWLIV